MVNEILNELEDDYEEIIEALKDELAKLRTGRANLSMLDDIRVEYYGDDVPLNQVATLRVPEPRLITIQPWEKDMIPKIEKAIRASDLGLNPTSDSEMVRVPIPALSGERREELSDVAREKGEDHKIKIRNRRREANDDVEELEQESVISEDQMHRAYDDIDELTREYTDEVDDVVQEKVDEIQDV
ncbi:MAG: ribosome recycling factor [Bradymonadaceae bacterium]